MTTITIQHRQTGAALFSKELPPELETASWGKQRGWAAQQAVNEGLSLQYANLQYANLQRADLRGVNFQGADLGGANLQHANLRNANLRGVGLRGVDIQGADLQDADLQDADLRGANFFGAFLNSSGLIALQTDIWPVYIQRETIRIGCQRHRAEEWFSFSDEEIAEMDLKALGWWALWKPTIKALHERLLTSPWPGTNGETR